MKQVADVQEKIKEALTRGVEKVYPSAEALKEVLESGKKIRLYCGYDPSSPTLHFGHSITLRKLSQFQKLGHEVIMLTGDFTGMIGDPTDKTAARKKLSRDEVIRNSENYKKLAGNFLDFSGENPAQIKYNSEWSDKLTFLDLIEIASNFTVGQMIVRDMFQERIKRNEPIYLHEFLYPIAQGYDSLAMDVDLEVGGADQTFNMLVGRDLMKSVKNKEKFVLTTKLLTDPSGKKMGKTEGNMVSMEDSAKDMFGKIMSWPDGQIIPAFELLTDTPLAEIENISCELKEERINPRDPKARLAKKITSFYHGEEAAVQAEKEFSLVFKEGARPLEIPEIKVSEEELNILDLLIKTELIPSKSEAKRLVLQGAIEIDDEIKKDWKETIKIKKGLVIKAGKRKFIKLR
ncbi:MAG: tyrosine--tRNA ligase [Candidatus Portnoybacteria bacterium]|nr:tyrosine--tRNA ligase [Candidatus Portnoybacteria bacterium]